MGITDPDRIYRAEDLARGDVMFAATGVTGGDFLKGVRFFHKGAETHSVVMRSRTGTVRFVTATHHLDKKPMLAPDRRCCYSPRRFEPPRRSPCLAPPAPSSSTPPSTSASPSSATYERYPEFLPEVKEIRTSNTQGNEVDAALQGRGREDHQVHGPHQGGAAQQALVDLRRRRVHEGQQGRLGAGGSGRTAPPRPPTPSRSPSGRWCPRPSSPRWSTPSSPSCSRTSRSASRRRSRETKP